MIDRQKLEQEARGLSVGELRSALTWQETLADHYDDNMDFNGYDTAQAKKEIIEAELRRRGSRF